MCRMDEIAGCEHWSFFYTEKYSTITFAEMARIAYR